MTALLGTFYKAQTLVDGGVRLIIDMQCTLLELAQIASAPGTPLAIARITNEASMQQEPEQEQPKVSHENSKWLALRCKEPVFWKFLNKQFPSADHVDCESEAAGLVRYLCNVEHRSELDINPKAAEMMHRIIRNPYIEFNGQKS